MASTLPSFHPDPTLGRGIIRKSSSNQCKVFTNDSGGATSIMKRNNTDPTPRAMKDRPRGLRHFPPRHSVLEWKPLVQKLNVQSQKKRHVD